MCQVSRIGLIVIWGLWHILIAHPWENCLNLLSWQSYLSSSISVFCLLGIWLDLPSSYPLKFGVVTWPFWLKMCDCNVTYFLFENLYYLFLILGFLRSPCMRMESASLLSLSSLQFSFFKSGSLSSIFDIVRFTGCVTSKWKYWKAGVLFCTTLSTVVTVEMSQFCFLLSW